MLTSLIIREIRTGSLVFGRAKQNECLCSASDLLGLISSFPVVDGSFVSEQLSVDVGKHSVPCHVVPLSRLPDSSVMGIEDLGSPHVPCRQVVHWSSIGKQRSGTSEKGGDNSREHHYRT